MNTKKLFSSLLIIVLFLFSAVACEKPHVHALKHINSSTPQYAKHGCFSHYACECGLVFWDEKGERQATLDEVTVRSSTGFTQKTYTKDSYTLNYCVYEPVGVRQSVKKAPLILFLHGLGERGDDNQSQLKNAILKVNKKGGWESSVILAPQCPFVANNTVHVATNQWVGTQEVKNYNLRDVSESLPLRYAARLVQEYASYGYIDQTRIYVVGLSMGGFGVWDILARYPTLFAAGVPICGVGPIDQAQNLKDIPIYTFHGDDDPLVPYSATQELYQSIKGSGGEKILFKTFEGGSHNVWDEAITFTGDNEYPPLETWLFSQHK